MAGKNDWIVAGINNPTFNNNDFKNVLGMTPENTQMLSALEYKSSPFIKEKFKKADGSFDEIGFDAYYNKRLLEFSTFDESDPLVDNFEYSLFDTRQRANSRIKNNDFHIGRISNPDRITIGIGGRNSIDESGMSRAELAQTQPIFDTKEGKYYKDSPNDRAFVSNVGKWFSNLLFDDPLVIAQYDEDGVHIDPISGQQVEHHKGDYKLNGDGQYYYETLNGRSLVGKQVLSSFDIFSVDGEGINKYDFLDSDGLDKSVIGSIAKAAFTVAPMFIPYVGQAYSWALVARELSKAMPMMYGMASSLFGSEKDSQVMNSIAAFGHKFSSGTSEYAKLHTFAFENFANLVADVATQWGQLKAIANSINKLRGSKEILQEAEKQALQMYRMESLEVLGKIASGTMTPQLGLRYLGLNSSEVTLDAIAETMATNWAKSPLGVSAIKKFMPEAEKIARSRARLGADASLAYMAIVSNTDVYDSLILHGASKRDAALVALGSTLGMFGVDRYLHLGEAFFDGLTSESTLALRGVFKKEAQAWGAQLNEIAKAAEKDSKSKAGALIAKGMALGKKATNDYIEGLKNHSLGFVGKALTEGIEEVNEELVTDLAKQFYQIAGTFSPNFFNRSGVSDVGAWEHAFERYLMNFLGGAMGGGIFYGVDVVQNGTLKVDHSKEDLMYLISNHRTDELLSELDSWHKKGKLGNKNLSATEFKELDNGQRVYLTAKKGEKTLNDYVYDRIKETIIQLETILNSNGLNLGEDELFKQMVLGEDRFMALQSELQDVSYSTNYLNEFRTMSKKFIEAKTALKNAENSVDGTPDGEKLTDALKRDNLIMLDESRLNNIKALREEFEKINQERIEFLQGNKSLEYTDKMLFAIDPNLRSMFISMTFDEWVKNNKNKNLEDLSEAEAETYKQEYLEYKRNSQKLDLTLQYEIYKSIKEKVDPYILEIADVAPNYALVNSQLIQLFKDDSPLFKFLQDEGQWDKKLEGESEEDFEYRNDRKETEELGDFLTRRLTRIEAIQEQSRVAAQELLSKINDILQATEWQIDPVTLRFIHEVIQRRSKDLILAIIEENTNLGLNGFSSDVNTHSEILGIIKRLNWDLSNKSEISDEIEKVLVDKLVKNLKELNKMTAVINRGFAGLFRKFGYTSFTENNITSQNIVEFLKDLSNKIKNGDEEVKRIFKEIGREDVYNQLVASENILNDLLQLDYTEDSLLEKFFGEDAGFDESELAYVYPALLTSLLEGNFEYAFLTDDQILTKAKQLASQENDNYQLILSNIVDQIQNNSLISLFSNIDTSIIKESVVKNLLSNITKQVLGNSEDLEQILQGIFERVLNINDPRNFVIESDESDLLNQATYIIKLALAYLYAASSNPTYDIPVGHNAVLNDFAEKHKELFPDYKPLPLLQEDVALMAILELDKYLSEILVLDKISSANKINKKLKFINASEKFANTRINFFKDSKSKFQFTINDRTVDLLEGSDKLSDADEDVYIHNLENLFYENLHKLLKSGISFTLILENSKLIEAVTNINNIGRQKTNKLDDNIDLLFDYDKFIYLLTTSSISANDFEYFNRKRIEDNNTEDKKIAPLTIQQYVTKIGMAKLANPQIFKEGMDYLKKVVKDVRPFVDNIVFIDGNAGVGKTEVCAKNIEKFAEYLKGADLSVWLSAPKKTQSDNLLKTVGVGDALLRKELFEKILDPATYAEIMADLEKNNSTATSKYYTSIKLPDGNYAINLNKDSIKFNSTNSPDLLIIDEMTHFSGIELQILNEWAALNGVTIIGLGDTNLNGFNKTSKNIQREVIFAIRTPKLSISLRDVNVQKQDNLLSIISLINDFSNTEGTDSDYDAQIKTLKRRIKQLQFKVYNGEVINGDLITDYLTTELALKIASDVESTEEHGKVAYVGDISSDTYKTLLNVLKDEDLINLSEEDIQGQEYDYIVIDKNWSLSDDAGAATSLNFLKNLYTLISRGKVASITIDNGLTSIISPNKIEFNKAQAPNLKDAVESFKEMELNRINKLNIIDPKQFDDSIKPEDLSSKPKEDTDLTNDEDSSSTTEKSEPETSEAETSEAETSEAEENIDVDYTKVEDTEQPEPDKELDRKVIESVFGNDDNEELKYEELMALDSETPMRVYSSAHLSGLQKIKFNKRENKSENYWIDSKKLVVSSQTFDPMSLDFDNYIYVAHQTILDAALNISQKGLNTKSGLNGTSVFVNPESLQEIINSQSLGQGHRGSNAIVLLKFPKSEFYKEKLQLDEISDKLFELGYSLEVVPPKYIDKILTTELVEQPSVLRDLEIFTDLAIITDGSHKHELTEKLLGLKSLILFKHSYNDAPDYITSIISEEEFNNIEYKVVVRKKSDVDNFIGYTGLLENRMSDSDGFVYTIVAQIGNKEVTLGLLANPTTYKNNKGAIESSIARTISKLDKEDTDYQVKYDNLILRKNNLDKHIKLYQDLINTLRLRAKGNPNLTYEVKVSPTFSALSYIRRNSQNQPIVPKLVSSFLEFDSNFRRSHPYLKISKPYIYIGEHRLGISDENRGKAVIFISSDTLLNENELMEQYLNSKSSTNEESNDAFHLETAVPRVRMIILNPKGTAFRELSYVKLKELFKTEQTVKGETFVNIFPFEEDYMGARMYVSLWNWRANLNRFIQKYNKFKEDNNYTDEQLLQIALVADALYRRDLDPEMFEMLDKDSSILNLYGTVVTLELVDKLNEFNDSLANSVRQFRLGGSLKESGAYIRLLTNIDKGNKFYGEVEKPFGIYLTPAAAVKYYNITLALFDTVLDKVITLKNQDGTKYNPNYLITTLKAKGKNYANSISGLIRSSFSNGTLTIKGGIDEVTTTDPESGETKTELVIDNNEYTLNMPGKSELTYIPIILTKLFKRASVYKSMLEVNFIDDIIIGEGNNKTVINDLSNILQYEDTELDETISKHTALDYLLTLAFHGTTAKLTEDTPKATDAYFKKGFFADPFSSSTVILDTAGQKVFAELLNNEALFEINCEVDMPVFDVNISEINENIQEQEKPKDKVNIDEEKQLVISNIEKLQEVGLIDLEDISNYESMSISELKLKVADIVNKSILDNNKKFIGNNGRLSTIINLPYNYDLNEMTYETIGQYISKTYKRDIESNFATTWDGSKLWITLSNKESITIEKSNKGKLKIDLVSTVGSEANIDPEDKLNNAKLFILESFNKSEIKDQMTAKTTQAGRAFNDFVTHLTGYTDIASMRNVLSEILNMDISDEFQEQLEQYLIELRRIENHC